MFLPVMLDTYEQAEVESYRKTTKFASEALNKPLNEIMASSRQLFDTLTDLPVEVTTNLEIMTLSAVKMSHRLHAMKVLVRQGFHLCQ